MKNETPEQMQQTIEALYFALAERNREVAGLRKHQAKWNVQKRFNEFTRDILHAEDVETVAFQLGGILEYISTAFINHAISCQSMLEWHRMALKRAVDINI